MYERYNENARQSIFFARYEAAQLSSSHIQSHHLLLGLLRADTEWARRLFGSHAKIEALRKRLAKPAADAPPASTSVDVPLDAECRRILSFAAEEAGQLGHKHIGVEHLLLGVAREEGSVAAKVLREAGFTLVRLREEVLHAPPRPKPVVSPVEAGTAAEVARDLTAAAANGELAPLVGRERELERMIQILSRRTKNNPVLIGEPGVGKSALVDGLAQRIGAGDVPEILVELKVGTMDASALVAPRRRAVADAAAIICIEGLFDLAIDGPGWPLVEAIHVLEPRLARREFRCIATGTPAGLRQTLDKAGRLARHFEVVEVAEPDEDEAIRILTALQPLYERFHGVVYNEGTTAAAVRASGRFLAHRFLPDRAIDLMDEAAVQVKLRWEKADEAAAPHVTAEDVAAAVVARTGLPLAEVKAVWQQPRVAEWQRLARELAVHIPAEGNEWLPFLAAWLARSSAEAVEKLADAIRAAKARGSE